MNAIADRYCAVISAIGMSWIVDLVLPDQVEEQIQRPFEVSTA